MEKPFGYSFLRENLLIVVGTCIHQYVLRLIEVIPVTHLVHLLDEAVAHLAAAEEGDRLDGKAAPGFLVQEQGDVLKESIVGGYGVQTVDGLRVFAIQRLCRFQFFAEREMLKREMQMAR